MRTIAEDDFKLLRRFVEAGSQQAFSQLVERHINMVYSVCLRETRDAALAQDVTQAVFLILFRKAPTIRRGTVLAGWLFNTSRFASRNAMRQEARRKAMEQNLVEAAAHSGEHDEAWRSIEPLLHEGIASLGARDRDAILLRYFEDKSLKEVGLALGITDAAAQMRVARALEKLKRFLQKKGVSVPPAILGAVLLDHAVQAAPASCAQAVGQAALRTGSATAKARLISQEVTKSMFISKLKAASLVAALGVAGVACLSGVVAHQSDAQTIATPNPAWPSGVAILQKSKAAYAALSTYDGNTTVHREAFLKGKKVEYGSTANIQFRRPNFLHIDGLGGSAEPYKLAYDGEATSVEIVLGGEKRVEQEPKLRVAIAGTMGSAVNAPWVISFALVNMDWENPFTGIEDTKLEAQEDIDGAPCYRVSITHPHDRKTFWVDAKTSLLRRFKREDDKYTDDEIKPYFSSEMHDFTIESTS